MSQSNTSKLFKGLSVQTVVTIVMGVLELVFFAIMSRLLSKADFGYLAAISGIMAICMSLSEAGLGSAVIQNKDASKEYVSTAFTLSILIGFIFSLVLFIFSPYIAAIIADDTLAIPLQIMSLTILLQSLISIGNAILYRQLSFKIIGLINVTSYIAGCALAVVLALYGFGLMSMIYMHILHALLTIVLLFGFYVKIPKLGIYHSETKGIVSFGGWLTIGVIFNNIGHQLDKLVLSKWLSVEALGSYNRPVGFVSTISNKINGIFDTVLFPILSELQDNKDKVQNIFVRAVLLLNSFSVILAITFFFNAELIIYIMFGEEWINLISVMQIVSISVIFNIDGRLVDCFFRSLNYVKIGTIIRFFQVILTLICLYIGAHYDIFGVACGLLISNVTIIIIKMLVLCVKVNCSFTSMFIHWCIALKPSIIPSIFGSIYLLISHTLILNILFFIIFYIIVLAEFVFFPNLINEEYKKTVSPLIKQILVKLKNILNY